MPNKHGDFVWYELMTPDAEAAQAFYSGMMGWTFNDSGMPGMDYRQFAYGNSEVGGVLPLTPAMLSAGARPAWLGYISVDDIDAAALAIKEAGGLVHREPWDIPGVGRIAMVSDPQDAPFYIMKGSVEGQGSTSFAKHEPIQGHCAWNELASSDPEGAKTFYRRVFDWSQEGEMDMGPMGSYQFWHAGGDAPYGLGAVYKLAPEDPQSHWLFYFRVPDIDAAVAYITNNGGRIFQEQIEIPDGEFSIIGYDPQGAAFGLIGPRV